MLNYIGLGKWSESPIINLYYLDKTRSMFFQSRNTGLVYIASEVPRKFFELFDSELDKKTISDRLFSEYKISKIK